MDLSVSAFHLLVAGVGLFRHDPPWGFSSEVLPVRGFLHIALLPVRPFVPFGFWGLQASPSFCTIAVLLLTSLSHTDILWTPGPSCSASTTATVVQLSFCAVSSLVFSLRPSEKPMVLMANSLKGFCRRAVGALVTELFPLSHSHFLPRIFGHFGWVGSWILERGRCLGPWNG